MYGVLLDESGNELDANRLLEDEAAEYFERYGKLSPDLYNEIVDLPADTRVRVTIAAAQDSATSARTSEPQVGSPDAPGTAKELSDETIASISAARDAAAYEANSAAIEPVVVRLEQLGLAVSPNFGLGLVDVELSVPQIPVVASWDEVGAIAAVEEPVSGLASSRTTTLTTSVEAEGITGSGRAVALIEANAYAKHTSLSLPGGTKVCTSGADNHASQVAGVITSLHSTNRGHAIGTYLRADGTCPGDGTTLHGRGTSLASSYRVQNLSWDTAETTWAAGGTAYQWDKIAYDYSVLVVACACNALDNDWRVHAPGLGYNVFAVGAFDDKNTGGSANWGDDVIWSGSRYIDPPSAHSDREKPEIVAPGVSITTTNFCPSGSGCTFSAVTGTSFAAPTVAALAALVQQRSSTIVLYPTATKSVLMVGAIHNIEGPSRLSEKDGVGGVAASYSDRVMTGAWGSWGAGGYACSAPSPLTVSTFTVQAGQTYRVAMNWFTDPAYSQNPTQPSADLDLYIKRSNGTVVATSSSWENTFEIVEFAADATETLSIVAQQYRCNSSPSQIGWAWVRVV